jgi:probable rRNA maturation factor
MEPGPKSPREPGFAGSGGEIIIADPRWHRLVPHARRIIARAMAQCGCAATVILTDDLTIKRLNARDRAKNKPTNVLTYEMPAEIMLASGVMAREARIAGKSVGDHLAHLVIHGALHLAGYEHEHVGDAKRMERTETRLLARLHVANPWRQK